MWATPPVVRPPSAATSLPVMNEACSEARKRMILAISSGLASRPSGMAWRFAWRWPRGAASVSGVAIVAGWTEFGVVQIRVTPKTRNPFTIKALSISGVTWNWHVLNHAPLRIRGLLRDFRKATNRTRQAPREGEDRVRPAPR